MLATYKPFLHLVRSKRLLSKFQGQFLPTHSIWYLSYIWTVGCSTRLPRFVDQNPFSRLTLECFLGLIGSSADQLVIDQISLKHIPQGGFVDGWDGDFFFFFLGEMLDVGCRLKLLDPWLWGGLYAFGVTKDPCGSYMGREYLCYGEREGLLRGRALCFLFIIEYTYLLILNWSKSLDQKKKKSLVLETF